MPAIVGVAQVISIGSSSIFNIGDVYKIMPISNAKTFSGSGSFNTGDGLNITNYRSATNTTDNDGIDQGNFMNA
ncbi:spore germination protein [Niallia taxi]|uniref:Spore germination protein n=2 Tax=Niallia TaxID=2837506 RepID=A0A437KHS2_9BACI|nr:MULTISPECIES: spore germination protein [Niallia]MCM3216050.1 spore germination protein [Niallia taxi]MDK8639207.1 spore germination protein [Niallia taxi]MED4037011.1 spore germination protein [Niallia taxi]MED4053173.1 spore germination protein [Niallia taxi]MED4119013.1 spore germination protein [Niallia taxi]